MVQVDSVAVNALIKELPRLYPGPGGVAAVVHQGQVIAQNVWGYADLTSRMPMADSLRMPVCSITKQFTCGVMLAELGSPEALDPFLPDLLPNFEGELPKARDLANNQSGLRDYWSLTILHGAKAEDHFPREAAAPLIARNRTGHFAPGQGYSYSNGNFRMLADLIERASGQDMASLYRKHLWGPAGMKGAYLAADTRTPPDGVIGYEGSRATGWWPAQNGIWWMGDAGMAASLQDMIAYEAWIDATRLEEESLYNRMAKVQTFRDGTPAYYGMGLQHHRMGEHHFTGHGGALRGYRSFRMYDPLSRLSVIVMFNHQSDAHGAGFALARAALGQSAPKATGSAQGWQGQWLCPHSGLLVELTPEPQGGVMLRFGTAIERLLPLADGTLAAGSVLITRQGDDLVMRRGAEHYLATLTPAAPYEGASGQEIAGRWHSPELGADMIVEAEGNGLALWFDGHLGQGRAELAYPAAKDIWLVETRRAMDAPAPGDWTLRVLRDDQGAVTGLQLGVWLARGLVYHRAEAKAV